MTIIMIFFVNLFASDDIVIIIINCVKSGILILILSISLSVCLKNRNWVRLIISGIVIYAYDLFMIIFVFILVLVVYCFIILLSHIFICFLVIFYVSTIILSYQLWFIYISVNISIYSEYNSLYRNINYLFCIYIYKQIYYLI